MRNSKYRILLALCLLMVACKEKRKVDLAALTLTEKAADIINYDDNYKGGVNTVSAPFAFGLQCSHYGSFNYDGIRIDSAGLTFQVRSDKIKNDSSLYQGGATVDQVPVRNALELKQALQKFEADSLIYGYRLRLKTPALQSQVLKKLINRYGPGVKNPNSDHGLYWNLKTQHRYVFFNPDYEDLTVLNSTHLSKTCYGDILTGTIDLGGCTLMQHK